MAQEPSLNQTEASLAWDDLRTSPAFPAIVGGLAGAVGGIALMFIFSRLTKPKETLPAAYDANGNPMNVVYLPAPSQFRIFGFTVGELMTLATVGFSLYRQIAEFAGAKEMEPGTLQLKDGSMLPPSPAGLAPVSGKKL